MPNALSELETAIERRRLLLGVMGLGYVGLPLVRAFCRARFRVLGFDTDPAKVAAINEGRSYIESVNTETVKRLVSDGAFSATTDMGRLGEADAICICVPTPLTRQREPDLTAIRRTGEAIARTLRPGQLIVLESTTYPGTTREVLQPILEMSGLALGRDFALAYSPERENPGDPDHAMDGIPKVVGGVDALSARLAAALYAPAVARVVPVSSADAAEACKIIENIYRSVNIALVNELKMLFDRMGLDVHEIIAAAATKPFGFQPFYPGPGLGGHCIPIDPFYLTWKAREYEFPTRFIELAGEINQGMPRYVVEKVQAALNRRRRAVAGSRILILGFAYKPDVDDVRESPAFRIWELLAAAGADLCYHDPHVPALPAMREHDVQAASVDLTDELLRGVDCALIVTHHRAVDYARVVRLAPLVVDSRGVTRALSGPKDHVVIA